MVIIFQEYFYNIGSWPRFVNNTERSSIIDNIYCTNPLIFENIISLKPIFGDNKLINGKIWFDKVPKIPTLKRNWVNYNKEALCRGLRTIDWNILDDSVQGY
jgi:hypothetical protein